MFTIGQYFPFHVYLIHKIIWRDDSSAKQNFDVGLRDFPKFSGRL